LTTISIHQPGYIPWAGFFKKIELSNIFVYLNDAQFKKNDWQNRNKIRTSDGLMWLSVPVKSNFGVSLNKIEIDNSGDWSRKHKKSIELNYSKAKYFEKYWNFFESIYDNKFEFLLDLNMKFIEKLNELLDIKTKTILSSELNLTKKGSERVLEICKRLSADTYISGTFGKEYLNLEEFKKNNIEVQFQNFQMKPYKQCYEPFMPNVSVIDLIFNEGNNSKHFLEQSINY